MESEFKNFENQWNEALKEASVPPPDFVWENIEKELDQNKKKRVAFIWWKNPAVLSGIAAALVLGLTVLFLNNNQAEKLSQIIDNKDLNKELEKQNQDKKSKILKEEPADLEPQKQILEAQKNTNLATLTFEKNKIQNPALTKTKLFLSDDKVALSANSDVNKSTKNYQGNEIINPAEPKAVESYLAINQVSKNEIEKIQSKNFKNYANRFQPFRSHIGVDFEETLAENKVSKNKMWFGVNSGVAPFNPNFENTGFTGEALTSARNDAAFVSKSTEFEMSPSSPSLQGNTNGLLPNSLPESSFRNGRAVNFGFSFGKKLKKRLGIESGLRYMQASAFMSTNVYAINEKTGTVNSYFQSNYLDSKTSNTQTVLSVNATNKQLYNYFNVPLLLNYSIPLIKKLDIEALGGVSGDMFVLGNFDAQNDASSNLTAANSTFNLLNISGMGGLRLSYYISKSWEANLGSTYQQALISGVSSEQNLSFKPKTFGINYGVRFKMK